MLFEITLETCLFETHMSYESQDWGNICNCYKTAASNRECSFIAAHILEECKKQYDFCIEKSEIYIKSVLAMADANTEVEQAKDSAFALIKKFVNANAEIAYAISKIRDGGRYAKVNCDISQLTENALKVYISIV